MEHVVSETITRYPVASICGKNSQGFFRTGIGDSRQHGPPSIASSSILPLRISLDPGVFHPFHLETLLTLWTI